MVVLGSALLLGSLGYECATLDWLDTDYALISSNTRAYTTLYLYLIISTTYVHTVILATYTTSPLLKR